MPLFSRFFLIALLVWPFRLFAEPHFTWTPLCQKAYDQLISLRLNEGLATLADISANDPENRVADFLADYADFFRFYIHEDEETYLTKLPEKRKRLKLLEEVDEPSPYTRYTQAEVHLHWAIARLKFEEYLGAFMDVKQAFGLLESNARLYPDFQPTYKSLSLLQAIVGSIPDKYRWGVQLLGMDGTLLGGASRLRELVEHGSQKSNPFYVETKMLYAFLQLHLLREPEAAWATVSDPGFAAKSNLTATFVKASVAMHTGHNDQALEWLEAAPDGPEYEPFHYLDFLRGLALLHKLKPEATTYLQRFLNQFEGRHYRKEACQKMAWAALIQGSEAGYKRWMEAVREEPFAVIDPDKAAEAEAQQEELPNPLLLKARLMYDGGYYQHGIELLRGKKVEDFDGDRDRLEFTYRAGRLCQALDQMDRAKGYYYATLQNESEEDYYYPASAALELGIIFEEEGDLERANYYFRRCLSTKDHVYESSLDAQAKAGLERLKEANF